MAKGSEYILSVGDDNVVLARIVEGKVANAWLASPDPALATEELGEALAEDPKCKISVLIDTLDQTFREEEIPKVGVLDRRKVLGRHVNMAFPGANLRGAKLVEQTDSKALLYQFAAVPLEGRLQGWVEFVDSLPNDKGGYYAIASENVDIIEALAPKDAPPVEQGTQWRHLIGVNATGGLRQIIEKNGRLCLTRLTQAPPPETPPDEFADMISRDFKATITYIRRLGYAVGDALDLVILTSQDNKAALDSLNWEGARSVSIYTPYEAAVSLGLGSIGREDQASCDVLHAAYFASKPKTAMPLSRAAVIGDIKDDIRELAFVVAPFAASILSVALVGWTLWTTYDTITVHSENGRLQTQYDQLDRSLKAESQAVAALPYEPALMRNVITVNEAMEVGSIDFSPALRKISSALQSDAVVLSFDFATAESGPTKNPRGGADGAYTITIRMRLADVIAKADEAVQVARTLLQRLTNTFGTSFKVEMTAEPAAPETNQAVTGNLIGGPNSQRSTGPVTIAKEYFYTEFKISKVAP